jgi:hypothetical protein
VVASRNKLPESLLASAAWATSSTLALHCHQICLLILRQNLVDELLQV